MYFLNDKNTQTLQMQILNSPMVPKPSWLGTRYSNSVSICFRYGTSACN